MAKFLYEIKSQIVSRLLSGKPSIKKPTTDNNQAIMSYTYRYRSNCSKNFMYFN